MTAKTLIKPLANYLDERKRDDLCSAKEIKWRVVKGKKADENSLDEGQST